MDPTAADSLAALLRQRLDTIADRAFCERDPAAHLEALRSVSLAITDWHRRHQATLPPRLDHFLTGCSYEKALRFLDSGGTWQGH